MTGGGGNSTPDRIHAKLFYSRIIQSCYVGIMSISLPFSAASNLIVDGHLIFLLGETSFIPRFWLDDHQQTRSQRLGAYIFLHYRTILDQLQVVPL